MIWTLSNILTVCRIALCPVIALLPFIRGYIPKLIAFVIFLIAAFSDLVDGRLARERNEVTEIGKLLDPLADKLLLFSTLVPIYWITTYRMVQYEIPWWGSVPLWAALVLVGREVMMTVFRYAAKQRGVIIAAMGAGKLKTIFQDIFIGATIAWFAWKDLTAAYGWETGWFGAFWEQLHGTVVAVTLAAAVLITVFSLGVYLYKYRALLHDIASAASSDGP